MSVNSWKGVLLRIMAGVLALALIAAVTWGVDLYANHGSLRLNWGVLPTVRAEFLNGSGQVFQQASWHLGNATRTWGDTYGVKIHRWYVSVQVTHLNPRITPDEAREND